MHTTRTDPTKPALISRSPPFALGTMSGGTKMPRSTGDNNGAPNAGSSAAADAETDLQSPSTMRQLVLNYLIHHCYVDTAIAFAQDGIGGSAAASASGASGSGSRSSDAALAAAKKLAATSNGSGAAGRSRGNGVTSAAAGLGAGQGQGSGRAHPLAAPPLSRDDSAMEIEAETLASRPLYEQGAAARSAYGAGADEDEEMGASQQASHQDDSVEEPRTKSELAQGKQPQTQAGSALAEADLSQQDILAVLLRRGEQCLWLAIITGPRRLLASPPAHIRTSHHRDPRPHSQWAYTGRGGELQCALPRRLGKRQAASCGTEPA